MGYDFDMISMLFGGSSFLGVPVNRAATAHTFGRFLGSVYGFDIVLIDVDMVFIYYHTILTRF